MILVADRRIFAWLQLAVVFLLGSAIAGCKPVAELDITEFSGGTMGTTYSVKVADLPANLLPRQVADRIQAELDMVNHKMSTYREDSELSRFNQLPAGSELAVSADTFAVLQKSLDVWRRSQGTFDVTVGPLVNLWGFGPEHRPDQVPTPEDQRAAWKRVGSEALVMYPDQLKIQKNKDLYVDLSAIAKGFGVDKVAEALESMGIRRYMVEVGGEIRVGGGKADGQPWRLAVEKPVPRLREVQQVIEAENLALATSGDYRNYFEQDGVRYSHTIDPRTGKPIQHKLVSATVVASECADADAWATAMMVLGPEQGLAVANAQNLAVYLLVMTEAGLQAVHSQAFAVYLPGESK